MKSLLKLSVASGVVLLALVGPMNFASAQIASGAVADLVRQGDFWRSRGRGDLAAQAYNRALQLDPGNAAARRGLAGPAQAQAPAAPARPAPSTNDSPTAQAAAPRQTAQPRATTSAADRAGRMRVAGYAALDRGELASAATQFQQALAINGRDTDALGGLGVTRLRQERFSEARDLLERASQGAGASRWTEALASARFFALLGEAEVIPCSGSEEAFAFLACEASSSSYNFCSVSSRSSAEAKDAALRRCAEGSPGSMSGAGSELTSSGPERVCPRGRPSMIESTGISE